MGPDFSGYATKAGLKCSDGRTITAEAFKHQDKMIVPLVWQHGHNVPENVLGHAVLEARPDGIYAQGFFNDTSSGVNAKKLVKHKDITKLSIYANQLVEKTKTVLHGMITEVSLVLAGANPGAVIDWVQIAHSDGEIETLADEAIIHTGLDFGQEGEPEEKAEKDESEESKEDEKIEHADDPTAKDIYNTLNADQKELVNILVSAALEDAGAPAQHSEEKSDEEDLTHKEGNDDMPRNVFEQNDNSGSTQRPTLTHAQLKTIVDDAQKLGSFKESFLQHAVEYGIENIDYLFPDARNVLDSPQFVSRKMEWVAGVINGTKHSPFSRIKTMSADITLDTARAKGYVKATLKKEEWFTLSQRTTTPTTIYKKQKLDRDDIIDITDLDVVAWLKAEMRVMLDEEIARAILVGDGREVDDDDKINEANIRPIAYDDDFYNEKVVIPSNVVGDALVEAILRARPKYRGTGSPSLYILEDTLTDLLLVKDGMGRRLYPTSTDLAAALRVKEIITVPIMEDLTNDGGDILAIMVNLVDYTLGADKGGAISMFDDFDIDYNQYKYLIETRLSGALTLFKSAITFSRGAGTLVASITAPTFVAATGVVTIPTVTGVVWKMNGVTKSPGAQTAIASLSSVEVTAEPATDYYFHHNIDTDWDFTRTT
jgi:HK97 family phage prohead protease